MRGSSAKNAKFNRVDLSYALLNDSDLQGSTFDKCDFRHSSLVNGNVRGSSFHKCDFAQADLTALDARDCLFNHCSFRDAVHSCLDLRDSKFIETYWCANRCLGGNSLQGADIEGLIGITESHFIGGEIIRRISRSTKFQMLSGLIWSRNTKCWQAILHVLQTEFTRGEREEILGSLTSIDGWFTRMRLEYEYLKQSMCREEYGCDYPSWPKGEWSIFVGTKCLVSEISGRVGKNAYFVPDTVTHEGSYNQDELFALAHSSRSKNGLKLM